MLNKPRKYFFDFHWSLAFVLVLLLAIGLVNLYSAASPAGGGSSTYFKSQILWMGLATLALLSLLIFHYRNLLALAPYLYGLSLVFLILVIFLGKSVGGQKNWLLLGPIQFQPSEFAKLALILMLSRVLQKLPEPGPYGLKDLTKPIAVLLAPLLLILMEKDLGSAIFIVAIGVSYFFLLGLRWRLVAITLILALGLSVGAYQYFLSGYQRARIQTFLHPEQDPRGKGYHLIQSKVAVGSGGFLGKGYLTGSLNKFKFLPERHTDFVFPVLAEEWGFVGSAVLLILYAFFLLLMLQAAAQARDKFGGLLCFGVAVLFLWQWVINLGGVLGLLPLAGVTLPFLSYGGSALVTSMLAMGLVFNVYMRRHIF